MHFLRILFLGVAATFVLAGCTTTDKAATGQKPAEKKDEYVRQTSTGSWIPKKVRKADVATSEQDTAQTQDALGDLQRRANSVPKDSGR